jgi:hypothetical protein
MNISDNSQTSEVSSRPSTHSPDRASLPQTSTGAGAPGLLAALANHSMHSSTSAGVPGDPFSALANASMHSSVPHRNLLQTTDPLDPSHAFADPSHQAQAGYRNLLQTIDPLDPYGRAHAHADPSHQAQAGYRNLLQTTDPLDPYRRAHALAGPSLHAGHQAISTRNNEPMGASAYPFTHRPSFPPMINQPNPSTHGLVNPVYTGRPTVHGSGGQFGALDRGQQSLPHPIQPLHRYEQGHADPVYSTDSAVHHQSPSHVVEQIQSNPYPIQPLHRYPQGRIDPAYNSASAIGSASLHRESILRAIEQITTSAQQPPPQTFRHEHIGHLPIRQSLPQAAESSRLYGSLRSSEQIGLNPALQPAGGSEQVNH